MKMTREKRSQGRLGWREKDATKIKKEHGK